MGHNVVDHLSADGSNDVAISIDVHDLAMMQRVLTSPDVAAAKQAHGVIDPLSIYIENI